MANTLLLKLGIGAVLANQILKSKSTANPQQVAFYKSQVQAWLNIVTDQDLISGLTTEDATVKAVIGYVDSIPAVHTQEAAKTWTLTMIDKYNIVKPLLEALVKANPKIKLQWDFAPNHKTVQGRINRIVGDGFFGKADYFLYERTDAGWDLITRDDVRNLLAANPKWKSDPKLWTNIFIPVTNPILYDGSAISYDRYKQIFDANQSWHSHKIATAGNAVYWAIGAGKPFTMQESTGGYMNVNWMHWDSPDAAMQGIFKDCTQGPDYPAIDPGDTYKAYSYPTPDVEDQYGSNLGFFVRCAPASFTCQALGFDLSIGQALMIVGSVVATIATVGAASSITIPALIAGVTALEQEVSPIIKTGNALQKAAQTASQMVNIYNGASTIVTGGTPDDLKNAATDFVENNQDIFTDASA